MKKKENIWLWLCILFGFGILLVGKVMNSWNHYISSLLIVVSAIGLYFLYVFKVVNKNWLDIRPVFAAVWLATVGLATLRLANYQKPWETGTWLSIALAYLTFEIGAHYGILCGRKYYDKGRNLVKNLRIGRIRFDYHNDRLFAICVVTTLIGIACFSINVAIRGFIPCFATGQQAYMQFYTRFHVFSVAATGVSGLCFYCIKTQKLALWKKLVLYVCIFYLVFLFPIMVVSRGVFIVAALSLTVTVFYLYRRKLIALILCVIVIFGVYMFASELRNYTSDQMNIFFEPSEIQLSKPEKEEDKDKNEDKDKDGDENEDVGDYQPVTFQLPPRVAFLYSYLTVSHDNLNEAVEHTENFTWGIRQLAPFNVILRSQYIDETIAYAEYYQVNPYLNTTNLIGHFYYDFGVPGVAICMLLWAFLFGVTQGAYEAGTGVFALQTLGNTMTPVALSFFATWLSNFSFWLMWGVVLLLAMAACLTIEPKQKKQ